MARAIQADPLREMTAGLAVLERALGPTIGPVAAPVVSQRVGRAGQAPESLTNGGDVCRRLDTLADPAQDVGFRLGRDAVLHLEETAGDGTASATAMAARLVRNAARLVAAGWHPEQISSGLSEVVAEATGHIETLSTSVDGNRLSGLVPADLDAELVDAISDAVDALGTTTPLLVRRSADERTSVQYVEGAYWETTRLFASEAPMSPSNALDRPRVLLLEDDAVDPRAFARALGAVEHSQHIVVFAPEMSPETYAVARANAGSGRSIEVVRVPGEGTNRQWALDDLAVITGARVVGSSRGDRLDRVDGEDYGLCDRIVVARTTLTLLSRPETVAASAALAAELGDVLDEVADVTVRRSLEERIARLRGGTAIVWVGGSSDRDTETTLSQARRAIHHIRLAWRHGVVPGAGASYLSAARSIGARWPDGRMASAADALGDALVAPTRWIIHNAMLADPQRRLAAAWTEAPDRGIDARSGAIVDLRDQGIVEPLASVTAALRSAASLARVFVRTDRLVVRSDRSGKARP